MKRMMKRFAKTSISVIAITLILLTNKLSLTAYANYLGDFSNADTITLQVGDTATLKCKRPYGYNSKEASWSVDNDGIISIKDENPGNTYSSITSATIEATNVGEVHVTMKAVSYWGEYWGSATETFTVKVETSGDDSNNDNSEDSDKEQQTETSESDSETSESDSESSEPDSESSEPDIQENVENEPIAEETPDTSVNPVSLNGKTLYVRLVGSYSHMMLGEEDIDAVSSATGVGYKPQEANAVKVQAVLVDDGTEKSSIADDAWKDVEYFTFDPNAIRPNSDTSKSKVRVSPECPGMEFFYNIWNGKIEASGKATQAGKYNVSIEFTDAEGRTAYSNAVAFTVYDLNHTLLDSLTYENSTQTADGRYIYDQVPWYITDLGATTVTVPKDIKAWYGSHTTGTYAEVGKIISLTNGEQPTHTLIIPSGANLTLLNTRIHSDVKVVVENGGKLTLRQSTIEGIVEILNGGTFSVDYNDFGSEKGFSNGSVLNGQLILQDGATLENAHIVSHTNYSARDDVNRINNKPIVVVNGNAAIKGEVTIKADEAGDYGVGQQGLKVNGTLNIPEGSVLKVYGGGESQLTSKGGDAIVLNNGIIQGAGELVAVGGFGMNVTSNRSLLGGGSAVSGSGTISMNNTSLKAGRSFEDVYVPTTTANVVISSYLETVFEDDTKEDIVVDDTKEDIVVDDNTTASTEISSSDNNNSDNSSTDNNNTDSSSTTNSQGSSASGNNSNSSSTTTNASSTGSSIISQNIADSLAGNLALTIDEESVPLGIVENNNSINSKTAEKSLKPEPTKTKLSYTESSNIETEESENSDNDNIEKTDEQEINEEAVPLASENNSNNAYIYIIIVLVLAALGGGIFYKRIKK